MERIITAKAQGFQLFWALRAWCIEPHVLLCGGSQYLHAPPTFRVWNGGGFIVHGVAADDYDTLIYATPENAENRLSLPSDPILGLIVEGTIPAAGVEVESWHFGG